MNEKWASCPVCHAWLPTTGGAVATHYGTRPHLYGKKEICPGTGEPREEDE